MPLHVSQSIRPSTARPLLKWAGGKRQLLPALGQHYPAAFSRYIEPFFGSGAVFFDLQARGLLATRTAQLSDVNADLVGCYEMLRDRTAAVITELGRLAERYRQRGEAAYYEVRDQQFNPLRAARGDGAPYTPALAAMVIFLNRTGFNGLFRLNRRGEFNVPVGRYANPRICDEAHLRQVAAVFRAGGVHLRRRPFDEALADAGAGDFVYCDPPYAPLSRTASFAQYTADGFNPFDQRRLQQAIVKAARRGAAVVLSNSSAPDIIELYSTRAAVAAGLRVSLVPARRAINARASSRGAVNEVIVSNVGTAKLRMAKAERRGRAARTA